MVPDEEQQSRQYLLARFWESALGFWRKGGERTAWLLLGNLLSNAIKYTPAGGAIAVRVRPEGDRALLEVEDTGAGIPPELLGKVFDLFVQSERTLDRSQGGLGIGLTLARGLVEMHEGTIQARSAGAGRDLCDSAAADSQPDAVRSPFGDGVSRPGASPDPDHRGQRRCARDAARAA